MRHTGNYDASKVYRKGATPCSSKYRGNETSKRWLQLPQRECIGSLEAMGAKGGIPKTSNP